MTVLTKVKLLDKEREIIEAKTKQIAVRGRWEVQLEHKIAMKWLGAGIIILGVSIIISFIFG